MILSGLEIKEQLGNGIIIEPFSEKQLGPNSYNLRLHNELMVYSEYVLDMKKENHASKITIPESGLLLEPNKLYLGRTAEFTKTDRYVPMLEGRSSVGRLGLYVHVTAGFGDIGFSGYWTLEIHCVQPVIIYPGIEICQIYYHTIQGHYKPYSSPKYQNNEGIQASKLYMDFRDIEGRQICRTCRWHDDDTWVCFNGDAEDCADFTNPQHSCPEWEDSKRTSNIPKQR